ncbi:DUF4282 domain-containing protein [Escherichia coli]|uniref:DUF4282 domain-containing protein n=1 Tax=Escherichia coli TaxID=562 RepID=UPI003B96E482
MKAILGFEHLLMPSVLVFFYWLAMVLTLIAGVFSIFSGNIILELVYTVIGLISCRMTFELIMIAFKNNEYLRRIAGSVSKNSAE